MKQAQTFFVLGKGSTTTLERFLVQPIVITKINTQNKTNCFCNYGRD